MSVVTPPSPKWKYLISEFTPVLFLDLFISLFIQGGSLLTSNKVQVVCFKEKPVVTLCGFYLFVTAACGRKNLRVNVAVTEYLLVLRQSARESCNHKLLHLREVASSKDCIAKLFYTVDLAFPARYCIVASALTSG